MYLNKDRALLRRSLAVTIGIGAVMQGELSEELCEALASTPAMAKLVRQQQSEASSGQSQLVERELKKMSAGVTAEEKEWLGEQLANWIKSGQHG